MKKREELKHEELNPYENDKLAKIPSWIKILLLKIWAAAAAFFLFGNASYSFLFGNLDTGNGFDIVTFYVFIGLGLGLFSDLIVKTIVRFMYNSRNNTYKYNFVNKRGSLGFFLCLGYSYLVLIPTMVIYQVLYKYGLLFDPFNTGEIGYEPVQLGILFTMFDVIFICFKNLAIYLYKRQAYAKQERKAQEISFVLKNREDSVEVNDEN